MRKTWSTVCLVVVSAVFLGLIGTQQMALGAGSESSSSDEQSTQSAYQKGMDQANRGNYEQALSLFKEARENDPNNADVLNMLAYSQRRTGKVDRAIENYKKALSIRPRCPEAREYLGEAYLQAALAELKTLEGYEAEGREQYRELKQAIKEAARALDE